MRRALLIALCVAALAAAVGVARAGRSASAAEHPGPAPTLATALGEHVGVRELVHERWLRANPIRIPLVFDWPARGSITGAYGNDGGRPHPGIDIGILRSLKVTAAARGRVVVAGRARGYEGYGKLVVVRSGRYRVLYAHLARVAVHRGQLVARDAPVGTAGCTGWCTGTHLHFEVRRGGRTVDPLRMLANAS